MKKSEFKQILQQLIKEEVKRAVALELKEIKQLLESTQKQPTVSRSIKQLFPQNQSKPASSNDVISSLLQETAATMGSNDYRSMINANSSMVTGYPDAGPVAPINSMESFNPMINSTEDFMQPQGNFDSIESISSAPVPDFSALMKTMKDKNMI
jgi:hypothetical protein